MKQTNTIAILVLLSVLNLNTLQAQTPVSLQEAIDIALKNNLTVTNEKLQAEYQKKLLASAIDIPQTNLDFEYGQFNSIYKDTKFGISQSINFPTVYIKQKALQKENYQNNLLRVELKEADIKKQVSEVFYTLVYLDEKKKILLHNDSIYAVFLSKANLRFQTGESNILEKPPQKHNVANCQPTKTA
ncbi:MAG: TolC family protein [Chitinophagales bacterium]|nr:TolC family protein [Chitinophagales bacterium]